MSERVNRVGRGRALGSGERRDAANELREIKEQAHHDAEREAKKIVALSIQRMAADLTADERTSALVTCFFASP